MKPLRVFVGPMEVAGVGSGYAAGLRECGVEADFVSAYPHPFGYAGPPPPMHWAPRLWARAGAWRRRAPRSAPKALAVAVQALLSWAVLGWALGRYQAFVFIYGQTITNTAFEGWLLRQLGRRTVMVFLGSDARPPFIDGGLFAADRPFDVAAAQRATRRQRRRVQRLESQMSLVVNARATAQFQRQRFVNWFALGIPRPTRPQPMPATRGAVRVLHSPSHPALKGTAEITATVERLRAQGLAIELVLLQGRPNAEVLQALAGCHLVVDQLYSDTPLAAFATEALSVGRPVLVGGVAADGGNAPTAPWPLPPSVWIRPEALEPTLHALALDASRRATLGALGAEHVAAHLQPAQVGARLLRLLRGDVPSTWWCEPAEVLHVAGCGLPEAVARERVAALIDAGGVAALGCAHHPALEAAFERFAQGAEAAAP